MKKALAGASLLASAFIPQLAQADFLSVYAGVESWRVEPTGLFGDTQQTTATFNFDKETSTGFYLGLEHPIPVIPNIKLRRDKIDTEGRTVLTGTFTLNGVNYSATDIIDTQVSLEQTDVVAYWELLDLDLFSLDIGLNAKHIDTSLRAVDQTAKLATDNFKGWVPMGYAAAEVSLPTIPLSLWGEGSYIGYSGDKFYDARAAIKYRLIDILPMELALSVGYRVLKVDVDDLDDVFADIEYDGYYAGMELRF